jgi:hypothetical protein
VERTEKLSDMERVYVEDETVTAESPEARQPA